MSDEDKLFNFMSGLQPWAQTELRKQDVRHLLAAIVTADSLVDFRFANASPFKFKKSKPNKRIRNEIRVRGASSKTDHLG